MLSVVYTIKPVLTTLNCRLTVLMVVRLLSTCIKLMPEFLNLLLMWILKKICGHPQIQNADGTWVKLDKESMLRYCHESEGEAWSLATGTDNIMYLQHELDLATGEPISGQKTPFTPGMADGGAPKGFDFTNAQHTPPSFNASDPGAGGKNCCRLLIAASVIFTQVFGRNCR